MDPYEVLGVVRGATPEQIEATYRRKARILHPDVNASMEATVQFQAIQLAHDQLTGKAQMPIRPTATNSSAPTSSSFQTHVTPEGLLASYVRAFTATPWLVAVFGSPSFTTTDFVQTETALHLRERQKEMERQRREFERIVVERAAQAKRGRDHARRY